MLNDNLNSTTDEPGQVNELVTIDPSDRVPLDEIKAESDCMITSFFDHANSMDIWFEVLQRTENVPYPETVMVDVECGFKNILVPMDELAPLFLSEDPDLKISFLKPEESVDNIATAVQTELGNGPVFVRSFAKSAEHLDEFGVINTVTGDSVKASMAGILDDHTMSRLPVHGFAFREYLDLDFNPTESVTGFNKPSLHPEVRFFIDGDANEVMYWWPRMHKETFVRETGDESFYCEQVERIDNAIDLLTGYAQDVADVFKAGSWSVDFVQTTDGDWYCTDMALNALYFNEEIGKWNNMSEHETGTPHNLEETVGTELPPPESHPDGYPGWRLPQVELEDNPMP